MRGPLASWSPMSDMGRNKAACMKAAIPSQLFARREETLHSELEYVAPQNSCKKLRANRCLKNCDGGYWVFGPEAAAADHVWQARLPLQPGQPEDFAAAAVAVSRSSWGAGNPEQSRKGHESGSSCSPDFEVGWFHWLLMVEAQ